MNVNENAFERALQSYRDSYYACPNVAEALREAIETYLQVSDILGFSKPIYSSRKRGRPRGNSNVK